MKLMEKQTGRKIKVFQFDHVGSTMIDSCDLARTMALFHFIVGKHGEAKKMNCSLLEKLRYLLSNAKLNKSFQAEALEYASHLMNRLLSTVIGGKTSLDIWSSGVAQDYSLLRVFECPTYFSVKDDKLNLRAKMFAFLGVKRNLKGYKL